MELNFKIQFKTDRAKEEFDKVDKRAQAIAFFAAYYLQKLSDSKNYTPTITSIYRSQTEQDALVNSGAPAVKSSAHTDYRAIDFRLNDYPASKWIPYIEQIININFKREDGKPVALVHGEGAGKHLHLQVPKDKRF